MSEDCVFCAIVAGTAPASLVYEDELALAFVDLRQAVSGHVLIVPRAHVPDIYALDEELAAHLMRLAVRIARALAADGRPDGLSLWQSNGAAAMQEVPHFHLHVHPRRHDDGLLDVYPQGLPAPVTREALQALAQRIAERLLPH